MYIYARFVPEVEIDWRTRFWGNINVLGPDDCWLWEEGTNAFGYGRTSLGKKEHSMGANAHRIAYWLTYGPPPFDRPFVLHTCDNPPCCNPRHLFPGTHLINTRDRVAKGRSRNQDGEANNQAKLNWALISRMRAAYRSGEPKASIVARYVGTNNVGPNTIYGILAGTKWKEASL